MKAVLPRAPTGRAVSRVAIAKLLATRQVGNELAVLLGKRLGGAGRCSDER